MPSNYKLVILGEGGVGKSGRFMLDYVDDSAEAGIRTARSLCVAGLLCLESRPVLSTARGLLVVASGCEHASVVCKIARGVPQRPF